jgi:nitrate/TMAO reductase-like tetraheme cytochrome c subunit
LKKKYESGQGRHKRAEKNELWERAQTTMTAKCREAHNIKQANNNNNKKMALVQYNTKNEQYINDKIKREKTTI